MATEPEKVPVAADVDGSALDDVDWSTVNTLGVPVIDHDTAYDPFWSITGKQSANDEGSAGDLLAAWHNIPEDDLYKASYYRMGEYITKVAPREALARGWSYVLQDTEEPVETELDTRLKKLTREWKIKKYVIKAIVLATKLGRSLLFKYKEEQIGKATQEGLRVCRIPQEYMEYVDGTSIAKEYRPLLPIGKADGRQVIIKPEDAVLFVHDEDPLGNTKQGIAGHYSSYATIMRAERITRAFTNLIENRGMGVFMVGIKQGNPSTDDLTKYAKMIGNPGSRSMIFYPWNLMEIKVEEGIRTGFDYKGTDERLTRHAAMSTGYPGMSMEGEKVGKVSGSETDQDNQSINYTIIQEEWEDIILEVYYMLDPTLKNVNFELSFRQEVQMNPAEQAQIRLTNIQAANMAPELYTVNEVRALVDLPALEGIDGEKSYAEFKRETMAANMEAQAEFYPDDDEGDNDNGKGGPPAAKKGTKTAKIEDADSLLRDGFSTTQVNKILQSIHDSGLSPNEIQRVRNKIREEEE